MSSTYLHDLLLVGQYRRMVYHNTAQCYRSQMMAIYMSESDVSNNTFGLEHQQKSDL